MDIEGEPKPASKSEAGSRGAAAQGKKAQTTGGASYRDLAGKAGVSEKTAKRVAEVQDDPEIAAGVQDRPDGAEQIQELDCASSMV